jgi:probable HAF family extracellular repeat protein
MQWKNGRSGAVLVLLTAAFAPAARAQSYAITNLGTFNGDSFVSGVNAGGLVAGYANTVQNAQPRACLYQDGGINNLGTLGGAASQSHGINASGVVVGESLTAAGLTHAFSYAGDGPMQDIGTLGGNFAIATGINDSGTITGYAGDANNNSHSFIRSGGVMTDLGTLGGSESYATGINASGQVVGYAQDATYADHAYLYTPNVGMKDIGTLGGSYAFANAINNSGEVVGDSFVAIGGNTQRAFSYLNRVMTDLGTLGGDNSNAHAINNQGAIVGTSNLADGSNAPFLYRNGAMVNINTFLPANSGWVLTDAYGINDSGLIVGNGTFNGQARAFLLRPATTSAPAPSSLFVVSAGALVVGTALRRKRAGLK